MCSGGTESIGGSMLRYYITLHPKTEHAVEHKIMVVASKASTSSSTTSSITITVLVSSIIYIV